VHAEPGPEERQGIELRGIGVSAGVVTGGVFRWNTEIELVAEYDLDEAGIDAELGRFEQALDGTRAQIHAVQQRVTDAIGVEGSQIFDAHILVVDDPVLTEEVRDRVRKERKNVECILNRVADRYVQALESVGDDYLRDRASDIRDVTRRILRNLAGEDGHPGPQSATAAIVVAPDLLPSETAGLHQQAFTGIVTDLGSRTSHSAIMAQAMEIPAVVGLHDITSQVRPEDRLLIDGAQGAVHTRLDVADLGADFYAFSGHKMCGPTGIGVLWARRGLLEAMEPWQGGGEMIEFVERDMSTWAELPHKFEAGTPNIAGAVGMGAAVDYLTSVGLDAIAAHERDLLAHALDTLGRVPGIRIFGPRSLHERSAVVSFTLDDAHPHDISTILDSEGIAVRAGHHCAQLVMKRYGVAATARASFYLYNTRDEVDRLAQGLRTVHAIFG